MITEKMTRELIGRQADDANGEKIGKIGQVYVDERNGSRRGPRSTPACSE